MKVAAPAVSLPIPHSSAEGWWGAAACLGVLAYPGTDQKSSERQNQLINACRDYLSLAYAGQAGIKRMTEKRSANAPRAWLTRKATLDRRKLIRTIDRADRYIRERRFSCVQIAMQLRMLDFEQELIAQDGIAGFKVFGPRSRTALLTRYAQKIGRADEDLSTMKRHWEETIPVLHLAWAFYVQHIERKYKKSEQADHLIIDYFRAHDGWLQCVLDNAETIATELGACGFDPSRRIRLIAEK